MGVHANDAPSAATAVASEGGVKYRLVEAEEVDGSKTSQQGVRQTFKSKGKLNWAQFPMEGEASAAASASASASSDKASEETNSSATTSDSRQRNTRGRGRGGRFGGNSSGGRGSGGGRGARRAVQQDSNGGYYNGVWVPTQDPKFTADWAKGQIEFYFSPDNLVRDMFLRQHMDVDGYVPLAFVGSFQAVFAVHQDYESLLDAVKTSTSLELDEENEKIRLRENWKQWLWPNGDGTAGVARYIKLQEDGAAEASN